MLTGVVWHGRAAAFEVLRSCWLTRTEAGAFQLHTGNARKELVGGSWEICLIAGVRQAWGGFKCAGESAATP